MSWETIRFGELFAEPTRNGVYKSADAHGSGCKIVNMGEIFAYDFIGNQNMQRIQMDSAELEKSGLKENDLLFARRSLVESGAGKTSIVTNLTEPLTFESSIIRVRLDESKCYPLFYLYWMRSHAGRTAIGALVTGTNVKGIRGSALKDITVDYPEYETQKKIALLLNQYDSLIENNRKQIKLLEEAAQRLYKEWFVDLHFPGYETTPVVDGVPEGWNYKMLSDVFEYVRGKSYSSKELVDNSGTIMVNLKNIRAFGGYNRNAEKRFSGSFKDSQKLTHGDIVMGVTDMTQERRLVGHVAVIPDLGEEMTFSMDLIKLIPLSVKKSYLYATMYLGGYSKKISPLANGVNVLHLKPESMMNMKMLVPSDSIMDEFDLKFEPILQRIEFLQKQCEVAAEARDRLLPKLMSGEIEV